ncbi:hypothetical protein [Curtobacterium sp. MCBD17_003]|uniref:hypothetical protein n=1 Tax=Curtobacterium sp. MCBD17_003 TaxID=2175667 RepID=UPI000DA91D5B|nr:hypothetical protein [Curtobacterium sp. MCBD17_003]WIE54159.1 hypothetical protein DEI88_013690 [Curtobacterium sp. MCBD17_003]
MSTTSWLEIDQQNARPDAATLERSRAGLTFRLREPTEPAIEAVLAAFRSVIVRGSVFGAAFDVTGDDETTAWYLCRNRVDEYGLVEALLTSPAMAAALPGIDQDVRFDADTFEERAAVELDGMIASALIWGGSSASFKGRAAEAKRIGRAFSDALVGDRYEDFRVDDSFQAWSGWFDDVAWDFTWVITDRRRKVMTVVFVTDDDAEADPPSAG